jgi:hypothetical protein
MSRHVAGPIGLRAQGAEDDGPKGIMGPWVQGLKKPVYDFHRSMKVWNEKVT